MSPLSPRVLLALLALGLLGAPAASAQDVCLEYARGKKLGRMDSKKIDEASGLVASLGQPGVYWTHNDSGDSDRFFAIGADGDYFGQWNVRGGEAEDFEDVAVGPCEDGYWDCLYLADLGNNDGKRDDLAILRLREPEVNTERDKPHDAKTDERPEVYWVTFEGGADDHDFEAMLVDDDGSVYVMSKADDDVTLFRLPPLEAGGGSVTAEIVAWRDDISFVTGADMAPDGGRFVMRSAQLAWELVRRPGQPLAEAFLGEPLEIRLRGEQQGEAIAYEEGGRALLSTSEGEEQPIYRYRCARFAGEAEDDKADQAGGAGAAEEAGGCSAGAGGSGGLLSLLLAAWLAIRRRD